MLRRDPLSLPHPEQVGALAALLRGETVRAPLDDLAVAHHRLTGFVLAAEREGRVELPPAQRERLAGLLAVTVLRSSLLRRELPAIAAALESAGAPPLLVKGPAVADRLYPEPGLRTFVDLDLLVDRERLPAAVEALEADGWEPQHEFRPGFGARHGHDVHLVRRIGSTPLDVELHWRLGDDSAGEVLDLRANAERAGGVAVPAQPQQLLALAVHLLSDRAKRLIWIEDLARAARSASDEEWAEAFRVARDARLLWVLHRALDYPAGLLGLDRARPLPPGDPPPWGPLRAVETLDMRASTHVGRLAPLGWRDRARYTRDVLVPTRAGLEGTVGGDGAPLWRLAGRHVGKVIRGATPRRG